MTDRSEAKKAFLPDFAEKHGCAWFVFGGDQRDPNRAGGWASIGGQTVFRFSSWKELPEDIVWWTNLSKQETWAIGKFGRFKDHNVFGLDWHGWLSEQTVLSQENLTDVVSGISETFSRSAYAYSQWCQQQDQPIWTWGEGSVPDLLAIRLNALSENEPKPQPVLSAAFFDQIKQPLNSQELVGKRRLVVSLPRHLHVQNLWRARIPQTGQWSLLDYSLFPGGTDHSARWLADQATPLLVKIGEPIWRPGESERGIFWLGTRGKRFHGAEFEPIWMTGEDALSLSRFAEFQLLSVYVGKKWEEASPSDPLNVLNMKDPLAAYSNTWQLRSSSAWRALATPTRDPKHRNKAFSNERILWMRALDRRLCFEAAYQLQEQGFEVEAYGDGQAVLLLNPKDDPVQWASAIRQAGWCLPMGLAKAIPMQKNDDFNDFLALDHWLKRTGGMASRWNVDRLVAPWSSSVGSVRDVMVKAAQDLMGLSTEEVPHWANNWKDLLMAQARLSVNRLKAIKDNP